MQTNFYENYSFFSEFSIPSWYKFFPFLLFRRNFLYGCIIEKKNLAFSDPTPNGRVFAESYVGRKDVLVFR